MRQPAMTLLEVLLSLALLGGVAIACASWVGTAARSTEATAGRLRWQIAADAALALIGELIVTGDFAPDEGRVRIGEPERVRISGGRLEIDTRFGDGAATVAVELAGDRLILRSGEERTLLANVAAFEAEIAEVEPIGGGEGDAEQGEAQKVLTVLVRSQSGDERTRRYLLP